MLKFWLDVEFETSTPWGKQLLWRRLDVGQWGDSHAHVAPASNQSLHIGLCLCAAEPFLEDGAICGRWLTLDPYPAQKLRTTPMLRLSMVLSPLVDAHELPCGQGYLGDKYIPLTSVPLHDGVGARVNQ